jgi:hypothetical protein
MAQDPGDLVRLLGPDPIFCVRLSAFICLKGQDPELVRMLGPNSVQREKPSLEPLYIAPNPEGVGPVLGSGCWVRFLTESTVSYDRWDRRVTVERGDTWRYPRVWTFTVVVRNMGPGPQSGPP